MTFKWYVGATKEAFKLYGDFPYDFIWYKEKLNGLGKLVFFPVAVAGMVLGVAQSFCSPLLPSNSCSSNRKIASLQLTPPGLRIF